MSISRRDASTIRSLAASQYLRLRGSRGSLSVTASPCAVVRAAHRLLSAKSRRSATAREQRHFWLRCLLEEHRQAGITYHAVATGQL